MSMISLGILTKLDFSAVFLALVAMPSVALASIFFGAIDAFLIISETSRLVFVLTVSTCLLISIWNIYINIDDILWSPFGNNTNDREKISVKSFGLNSLFNVFIFVCKPVTVYGYKFILNCYHNQKNNKSSGGIDRSHTLSVRNINATNSSKQPSVIRYKSSMIFKRPYLEWKNIKIDS